MTATMTDQALWMSISAPRTKRARLPSASMRTTIMMVSSIRRIQSCLVGQPIRSGKWFYPHCVPKRFSRSASTAPKHSGASAKQLGPLVALSYRYST
jgi:hypothetical protein